MDIQQFKAILADYYDNMYFYKIKNIDNHYSMYVCKLNVHLANTQRYLIALTPVDLYNVGNAVRLSDLNWQIFQTRSLSENFKVDKQLYRPKQTSPYNTKIESFENTPEHKSYKIKDCPIVISLLHDDKNLYEYPDIGTLCAALETYKTIITLPR